LTSPDSLRPAAIPLKAPVATSLTPLSKLPDFPYPPKNEADNEFAEALAEVQAEAVIAAASARSKAKPPRNSREIFFEGPSEADKKAADNEKASPLVDAAGRPRYVRTRECWCSYSAPDECRFHSPKEKGWAVCPSKPYTAGKQTPPRYLWGINPDFGKPRDLNEVLAESQPAATVTSGAA
jgi:hypothetical protein